MTTVTVLLEDELINRLEQFTEKRHLTRDQVIRTALKSYLTSDESVLEADPLVGLFDFGDSDFAENSESILNPAASLL